MAWSSADTPAGDLASAFESRDTDIEGRNPSNAGQSSDVDMEEVALSSPEMNALIDKYEMKDNPYRDHSTPRNRANVIVLTGATGFLGSHLLAELLQLRTVELVYCLIRAPNPMNKLRRVLDRYNVHLPVGSASRYRLIQCDLEARKLGLVDIAYSDLQQCVTHIIHAAWKVDFGIPLKSFESTLHGLHNLLALTGSTEALARFIFMSSGTATLSQTKYGAVPEATTKLLAEDNDSGYAQSKLAAETIIDFAHELGYDARIYRVGQLVGHTVNAIWNEIGFTDMYPAIIKCAFTMGKVPELGDKLTWLPVDIAAKAIVEGERLNEISSEGIVDSSELVRNLVAPRELNWDDDVLSELERCQVEFERVSCSEWLRDIQELVKAQLGSMELQTAGMAKHPVLKFAGFLPRLYAGPTRPLNTVSYATGKATDASPTLNDMDSVVESSLLARMIKKWVERWSKEAESERDK